MENSISERINYVILGSKNGNKIRILNGWGTLVVIAI